MIREFFKDNPLFSSTILILILGIAFILIEIFFCNKETFYGKVMDKQYKSETTSVGTGTIVNPNGSVGVVTTNVDPEEFLIMVKTENGKIVTVKCEPELYYEKQIGEQIEFNVCKGFLTKTIWLYRGVK